jgi:microcystin-dependent protein
MLGGAILQKYTVVTESDFDTKVLKSSQPELVYFVEEGEKYALYDGFFETIYSTWGRDVKIYYVDHMTDTYLNRFGLYTDGTPLYAIFNNGEVTEQKYLTTNQYDIYTWVKNYMTEETATPTPPPNAPIVYRMYPAAIKASGFDFEKQSIGELNLNPYSYEHGYSKYCVSGQYLSKSEYNELYVLLGEDYNSNAEQFTLPDFSSAVPNSEMNYQIFTIGEFPEYDGEYNPVTIGDINYFPTVVSYISNDMFIGQIILAKNIDEINDRGILIPCDGRMIEKYSFTALYTLLGDRFGYSNRIYFYVPDLSSFSPIEGAKYYIVASGWYPSRFID